MRKEANFTSDADIDALPFRSFRAYQAAIDRAQNEQIADMALAFRIAGYSNESFAATLRDLRE